MARCMVDADEHRVRLRHVGPADQADEVALFVVGAEHDFEPLGFAVADPQAGVRLGRVEGDAHGYAVAVGRRDGLVQRHVRLRVRLVRLLAVDDRAGRAAVLEPHAEGSGIGAADDRSVGELVEVDDAGRGDSPRVREQRAGGLREGRSSNGLWQHDGCCKKYQQQGTCRQVAQTGH